MDSVAKAPSAPRWRTWTLGSSASIEAASTGVRGAVSVEICEANPPEVDPRTVISTGSLAGASARARASAQARIASARLAVGESRPMRRAA